MPRENWRRRGFWILPRNHSINTICKFSTSVMERAQELQENLVSQSPSFTKLMLRSHVSGGFWLGLPTRFCRLHLPKEDKIMILVDEDEQAYDTRYLAAKNGLSGGWKRFSQTHDLVEGDVLVFHLIKLCKFKVYIVRARKLTRVDGAISLLNLDCHAMPIDAEKDKTILLSETTEGIKFKDVKSFATVLDSIIPAHLREKYYELCCSQNMFLHDSLIKGLNSILVTGIISETIIIADAIRAVKSTTPLDRLESWDNTLKAFEDLGMVVGFLRARIQKLITLSNNAQAIIESKTSERDEAVEHMKSLMDKLVNVRELCRKLDAEIEYHTAEKGKLDSVFMEISGASW
ncbi:hypothetical protein ACJIZ3_003710 [Penstemon smallii]|uniref:TF-B3 domain-containing protein n=1 Tax=Penstemon smallii TaxID=265156 RepID=A0ABD3UDF1_9LAMI